MMELFGHIVTQIMVKSKFIIKSRLLLDEFVNDIPDMMMDMLPILGNSFGPESVSGVFTLSAFH